MSTLQDRVYSRAELLRELARRCRVTVIPVAVRLDGEHPVDGYLVREREKEPLADPPGEHVGCLEGRIEYVERRLNQGDIKQHIEALSGTINHSEYGPVAMHDRLQELEVAVGTERGELAREEGDPPGLARQIVELRDDARAVNLALGERVRVLADDVNDQFRCIYQRLDELAKTVERQRIEQERLDGRVIDWERKRLAERLDKLEDVLTGHVKAHASLLGKDGS